MYRPPKVRPKNLTIGGRYFYVQIFLRIQKESLVTAYLNGAGSYSYLAKTYGVLSHNNIEKWVHNYQTFYNEGLKRSIVELYLSSKISYPDLALQKGNTNPRMSSHCYFFLS